MVLKLFTTFIVVAAILASPKHRDFTTELYGNSIAQWILPGVIVPVFIEFTVCSSVGATSERNRMTKTRMRQISLLKIITWR